MTIHFILLDKLFYKVFIVSTNLKVYTFKVGFDYYEWKDAIGCEL